jgi:hypothetical protein
VHVFWPLMNLEPSLGIHEDAHDGAIEHRFGGVHVRERRGAR